MSYDKKFLVWALSYAIAGMGLGIFMAGLHDHSQTDTHAHILLVGFATSLIYGVIHKLWLVDEKRIGFAKAQFVVHQVGTIVLSVGLFLSYVNLFPSAQLDPVLAVGSIAVLSGALLMLFMVLKTRRDKL